MSSATTGPFIPSKILIRGPSFMISTGQMHHCYTPRVAASSRSGQAGKQEGDEAVPGSAQRRGGRVRATPSSTGAQLQREGDRAWNQFRPLFLDLDVVAQASGSAYLELEHTKVLCAVYGPKPRQDVEFSEQGKLLCDFRYAPFARLAGRDGKGSSGSGPQDAEERALSQVVAEALSGSVRLAAMPKAVLEVYVVVLQAHGGELGAAISCASLALATAGVELYGLVAACSVLCVGGGGAGTERDHDHRLLLDPTADEERKARDTKRDQEENGGGEEETGSGKKRPRAAVVAGAERGRRALGLLHLAFMAASGEVTQVKQEGVFEGKEAMEAAMELATDGAQMLHAMMRRRLRKALAGDESGDGQGKR